MTPFLCLLGFHSWPRLHGSWREVVVEPARSECTRCQTPLQSVWRRVYPADGRRCSAGSCSVHSKERPRRIRVVRRLDALRFPTRADTRRSSR